MKKNKKQNNEHYSSSCCRAIVGEPLGPFRERNDGRQQKCFVRNNQFISAPNFTARNTLVSFFHIYCYVIFVA